MIAPDVAEDLREALLELERARARERQLRLEGEALLDGLRILTYPELRDDLFTSLVEVFRGVLGFEEAFVLLAEPEGARSTCVAATREGLRGSLWLDAGLFERVLGGEIVAAYDVRELAEWRDRPSELGGVRSALHFPVRSETLSAVVVCTHAEVGFFGPRHVQLIRRFAPLARQGLANIEARETATERAQLDVERRILEERLLSQRDLRVTTSRLEALIRSLHAGVLVEDDQRRIRLVNQRFCHVFGIPVAPVLLLGADCAQAAEQAAQLAEDPERFITRIDELLERRESAVDEEIRFRDGRIFERDYVPIWDGGRYLGHLWQYRDITEKRQAEAARREIESLNAAILASALDCILTIDHQGRIVEFNPAAERTFGWLRDEVIGQRMVDLISPEALAHHGFEELAALGGLSPSESRLLGRRTEVMARRRDGSPFPAELAIALLEAGGRPFFTCFVRDITERREAERQLRSAKEGAEAANRAKSDFLASVSHELRTPLNVISGMAELLREEGLAPEPADMVAAIERSAASLLHLINDLLDVSRIEAGHVEVQARPFRTRQVVEEAMRSARRRADGKGLELAFDVEEAVPAVCVGDPDRLRQVLANLVDNGVKFTPQGSVRVRVVRVDDAPESGDANAVRLRFTVEDTGIGIAETDRERVFERFQQIDSSTSRRFGGVGLGLTISRSLVERMGGRLELASEPGRGSAFSFDLALGLPVAPKPGSRVDAAQPALSSSASARILLVEDSPDNRHLAVALLSRSGHRVELAHDGEEGLTRALESSFDLVLMDVEMPGMDGFEATRRIRQGEAATGRPPVPIVALTAHAVLGFRERCLEAGMQDYLAKPIQRAMLLATVERFAGSRGGSAASAPVAPAARIPTSVAAEAAAARSDIPDVVPIDPDLADLVPGYLDQRRGDVLALARAAAGGDLGAARRVGHNLKGSGAPYGFPGLSELGARIEAAALEGRVADLRELTHEFAGYLERVSARATGAGCPPGPGASSPPAGPPARS